MEVERAAHERRQREPKGDPQRARDHQRAVPEPPREHTEQPPLHHRHREADNGEEVPQLPSLPAVDTGGVQGHRHLVARPREGNDQPDEQQRTQAPIPQPAHDVAEPETARARNSRGYVPAKASSTYPAALMIMVASSTGRRPTRSDSLPRSDVPKNCIREYTPNSAPRPKPPAPRDWA